eukprot:60538-Rhodomonas_salina.3
MKFFFERHVAPLQCGSTIGENLTELCQAGEVELNNVKLRPSALEAFNLPVAVKSGQLAYVHFKIPWNSLGSSPVTVTVRGIEAVGPPLST